MVARPERRRRGSDSTVDEKQRADTTSDGNRAAREEANEEAKDDTADEQHEDERWMARRERVSEREDAGEQTTMSWMEAGLLVVSAEIDHLVVAAMPCRLAGAPVQKPLAQGSRRLLARPKRLAAAGFPCAWTTVCQFRDALCSTLESTGGRAAGDAGSAAVSSAVCLGSTRACLRAASRWPRSAGETCAQCSASLLLQQCCFNAKVCLGATALCLFKRSKCLWRCRLRKTPAKANKLGTEPASCAPGSGKELLE
jgi:hypothetical protein